MTKKYIELILNNKIKNLGNNGEIVKVSIGYARNYLIPKNQASLITSSKMIQIETLKQKNILIQQKEEIQCIHLKSLLEKIHKFKIKKIFSKTGQIFGSVLEKDICKVILEYTGQSINKNQIVIPIIKYIGNYNIKINFTESIVANLEIQVLPDIQS
uniref:50S ribosomal protein L9, chloroplastic n=1 Tax=Lympha mucosa TaxID=2045360 RepID=A0A6B9VRL4_9FLOR|nr:ribosomal protein L9 [Lympha mucosa]